jgi:DNA (cytosine-5)-methyltransferase 1
MDKLSKSELLEKCGIIKCKSKTKLELIKLIETKIKEIEELEKIKELEEHKMNETEINETKIEYKCKNETKYKMIDLFAGTGAFSYAFHSTNKVDTVFANDLLESSKQIYELNNLCNLNVGNLIDIENETIPIFNILTAGFPCQPFSIAGLRRGFEDERSNVFWKILSIINHFNPEVIILENVKNLQSHDNGNTFNIITDELSKLNYYVKYEILNTSKITNIPQNRERIYIVGFKNEEICEKFNFDFPTVNNLPIQNFLEENVNAKYYYSNKYSVYNEIQENVVKHVNTNTIYQYRRYYTRENKNGVCPTLTANMGSGGHNVPLILDDVGIRKLTPRECFNLQGFPPEYKLPKLSDNKLYSLSGNAVSISVVKLIAEKIIDILN